MWNHDYCTVCDKICQSGSIFCSDECRSIEAGEAALGSSPSSMSSEYCLSLPLVGTNYHKSEFSSRASIPSSSSSVIKFSPLSPPTESSHDYFEFSDDSLSLAPPKKEFMYQSPLLQPQSTVSVDTTNATSAPMSPPPSPLLMPCSKHDLYRPSSSQSSSFSTMSSYRRWLTAVA